MKKIQKRYPILAAIILLLAGYFGWYENDHSQDNLFEQAGQVNQAIQSSQASQSAKSTLTFRSDSLREEHFEKHGVEMGFASAKEYEKAAAAVVSDSRALHKLEKEDGDDVYYLKDTNEFVIVSTDGYIRTYFYPRDGMKYFERQ
ncbi:MAG: hypothetical protein SO186_11785 [Lachnospiraceae bacterium]|nr:hypothetical protein [Lachnospiraceae bacterium]